MQKLRMTDTAVTEAGTQTTVLEVTVSNHPGVMVHVCSLFSRRAYNMEGILCLPVADASESRIWILVNEDGRLEQVEKQLLKLADVRRVLRRGASWDLFGQLASLLAAAP